VVLTVGGSFYQGYERLMTMKRVTCVVYGIYMVYIYNMVLLLPSERWVRSNRDWLQIIQHHASERASEPRHRSDSN